MSTVVLITGASTGLGYEVARALCSSGQDYELVLAAMTDLLAFETKMALWTEFPDSVGHVYPVTIDVEDDNSIQKAFDSVKDKYGRLDVLVNNAGRCPEL